MSTAQQQQAHTDQLDTGYKYSDVGNAERFVERHMHEVRYVEGWRWLIYHKGRWQVDSAGQVIEWAKATVAQMRWEAAKTDDRAHRDSLWKWATHSERADRIHAMLDMAQSDRRIRAKVEDFDNNPYLLNVENGTLDLLTGELHPHNAEDLITKLSPVKYDPDASSTIWEEFLTFISQRDPELRAYLQRCIGYSLTGDVTEKVERVEKYLQKV